MSPALFITGHRGFIGSALVRRCEREGIEWVGYDLPDGDVRDAQGLVEKMPEGCVVVHLAGLSSNKQCDADPELAYAVNVEGTRNVVNAAHARKAKQIILASSEWVYEGLEGVLTEERLTNQMSEDMGVYARTKRAAEGACLMLQPYRSTILRFGIVYGPRQHASDCALHRAPAYEPGPCDCGAGDSAVESIFRAVRDRRVEVGSFQTARRFIHVEDIVSGILASVGREGYEVYNITGDELLTLDAVTKAAAWIHQPGQYTYAETNPEHPSIRDAPNTLARQALNWKPEYDLERGLRSLMTEGTNP